MKCMVLLFSLISLICFADSSIPGLMKLNPHNSMDVVIGSQPVSEYCLKHKNDSYLKCVNNKEIQWTLDVYESELLTSKKLGKIVVSVVPEGEASAKFYAVDGRIQDYTPNLVSSEYGNHFDFPILKQEGDWTQLPRNPFPQPVWINVVNDWKGTDLKWMLRPIRIGMVYTHTKLGNIVFTKISGDKVTYRDEYPQDMACGREVDKKIKKPKSKEVRVQDLLDKDGHLPIFETYWKGC